MAGGPQAHVDDIEHSEQGETPRDAVNDGAVAGFGELVDDGAEEEDVYDGPAAVSEKGRAVAQ